MRWIRASAFAAACAWCLGPALLPSASAANRDPLCGGYCTFLALKSLGLNAGNWEDFALRLGRPGSAGYSLGELAEVVAAAGGHSLAVETSLSELQQRSDRFACVAHLDGNHYVLLYDAPPGLVRVIDAPFDYEISAAAFEQRWDGRALLIAARPIEPQPRPSPWPAWVIGAPAVLLALLVVNWMRRVMARRSG